MYQIRKLILGSYRTYEEWKQIKDGYVYVIEGKVLTVPMRNGNVYQHLLDSYTY